MKKIKELLKRFGKKCNDLVHNQKVVNRVIYVIVILIMLLFGLNTAITMQHNKEFQDKAQSGNERWKQVYNIIQETESKVNELNNRVTDLENKNK